MKKSICLIASCLAIAFQSFAADAPKDFKVSGLTFKTPAGWEWVETTSQMRKAQLMVSDASSKTPAEVIFFYFGEGNGGGTKANVERWFGQFQEPREKINAKSEEVTVGKTKITYVQAQGTYKSGMPGGPQTPMADFGLAGAIIEDQAGSVFVRMTGPKALVEKSLPEFKKMIETPLK